jgi:putative chitinase
MIVRKAFFDSVRKDFGKLNQKQVNGFESILNRWEVNFDLTDVIERQKASYKFSTFWHETGTEMQPIYEKGKRSYFNKYEPHTKIGKMLGNIFPGDGYLFRGRGLVQITGRANNKRMGKILGIPLEENPDKALEIEVAIDIADEGMHTRKSFRGDFTGVALENFFNLKRTDPVGARAIINGRDRAVLIAGHYHKFLKAMNASFN